MRLASAPRLGLASVIAATAFAGCGSSAHPTAKTPVSLQQLHGNTATFVTYDINVSADDRVSVQRLARIGHLSATKAVMTIINSAGSGRLNAAERSQLTALLRRVDLRQLRAAGVRGDCYGPPIGDVGGVLLDVNGTQTDCPPASAQPLVSWLERLAVATPEKVTHKSVLVTPLRGSGSRTTGRSGRRELTAEANLVAIGVAIHDL